MAKDQRKKAILLLDDGTTYYGYGLGKIGTTTGEICFNTGMTGYQEVFTDPSYYGQLLVSTNVHVGNYGVKNEEQESDRMKISGLICRNFTIPYSRKLAEHSIQDYFEEQNVVCISGVDTRAIVKHIRNKGAMNAIISSDISDVHKLRARLDEVPSMDGLELASKVSTKEAYSLGNTNATHRIAAFDYGIKKNILNCFAQRDCLVKVFPAKTDYEEVLAWKPDAFFLSNGPGDPAPMDYAVQNVKRILADNYPLFGICLGHQLLALALDIPTYKMHHGHRGINHPVRNEQTGKCEITSQNHGFGVDPKIIRQRTDIVEITHVNLNDDTIEGIRVKGKPAFSVQYHPESSPGPHDSRYLFDHFIEVIKNHNKS